MKWTVTYLPSAKDDLATIWINALDRKAVANSAHSIDQLLGTNPLKSGESWSGEMRLLIEPPLAVLFDVQTDDRKVVVWYVREWK